MTKYLTDSGAQMEEREAAEWVTSYTLRETIDHMNQRIWSSTWWIPEEIFRESMKQTITWAMKEYGSLDRVYHRRRKFLWRRYKWS